MVQITRVGKKLGREFNDGLGNTFTHAILHWCKVPSDVLLHDVAEGVEESVAGLALWNGKGVAWIKNRELWVSKKANKRSMVK